jgi:flagellar protein FliL
MADEDEKMDIQPPANQVSQKNPLLTVILLLNTVLVGAVGFFQYTIHQKASGQASVQGLIKAEMAKNQVDQSDDQSGMAREENGILFPLDGFTANLAQGDGPRRFVRLQTVLKFSKESNEEEFNGRKPQIRDAIISTLNSKRPEDLLKLEGKNYLKEEIKAAINNFLVDGEVIDVFYVGFQIN